MAINGRRTSPESLNPFGTMKLATSKGPHYWGSEYRPMYTHHPLLKQRRQHMNTLNTAARQAIAQVTVYGSNTYTQFECKYQDADWAPVYLLLKGSMDDEMVAIFSSPEVSGEVTLAYQNNDHDMCSYKVGSYWKGIALGLELSVQGYYALKDGHTDRGMKLLQAAEWLSHGNTFAGIGLDEYIIQGELHIRP